MTSHVDLSRLSIDTRLFDRGGQNGCKNLRSEEFLMESAKLRAQRHLIYLVCADDLFLFAQIPFVYMRKVRFAANREKQV